MVEPTSKAKVANVGSKPSSLKAPFYTIKDMFSNKFLIKNQTLLFLKDNLKEHASCK